MFFIVGFRALLRGGVPQFWWQGGARRQLCRTSWLKFEFFLGGEDGPNVFVEVDEVVRESGEGRWQAGGEEGGDAGSVLRDFGVVSW